MTEAFDADFAVVREIVIRETRKGRSLDDALETAAEEAAEAFGRFAAPSRTIG